MNKDKRERYLNNAISKYPEFIEKGLSKTRQENPPLPERWIALG